MKLSTMLLSALLLGLLASPAEIITLDDGQTIRGRVVEESEDHIELEWREGILRIDKSRIVKRSAEAEPEAETEPERWRRALPPPHPKLSEAQRKELYQALKDNRDRAPELLAATKLGDDADRIRGLFAQLGRSEGFDHLGAQNRARRKLQAFGLKCLGPIADTIDSPNIHLRVNSLRLLLALAENNRDWTWYLYHFDLHDSLLNALRDQSSLGSFRTRSLANAILEKITGRSSPFEPNIKQRPSPQQARAAAKWRDYFAEAEAEHERRMKERSDRYKDKLERWTQGPEKTDPRRP